MKRSFLWVLAAALCASCVTGNKVKADAEVIKADIERARRTGAMRCAPRELATAEARREFALDELSRGNSFRAGEEMREAEAAAKKALYLSKDCGPKQILVREGKDLPPPTNKNPVVIKIERTTAPAITTQSPLSPASVGVPYNKTLSAQDGQPPYTWSLASGTLPPGLTLAPSGKISGTPSTPGSATVQVALTDASGQTAKADLTLDVAAGLKINTAGLPDGYVGTPYSATTVSATGGIAPFAWSVSTGSLPPGITLSSTSGIIAGTPTTAGTYSATVVMTDGAGQSQNAAYTINIYALPQISSATLADGSGGASYSQLLQASGGKPPLQWQLVGGQLPPGISLDPATGTLSGKPTAVGSQTFGVQVTDANGKSQTKVLSLNVINGLAVTSATLADGYVGAAYSQALTASGGKTPYTWSIASGTLPAGIALTDDTIKGTATSSGTSSFTVQVTDSAGQSSPKQLSLTIYDAPTLTVSKLPEAAEGQPYGPVTLQAQGGKPPYSYSLSGNPLPPGLTLSPTGVLAGTPAAAGSANVTIAVKDANGKTTTEDYGIAVKANEKVYKMVVVKKDRIEIKKQIRFRTASSKIIGSDSFEIIAEVAQAMRDYPQIKKLRVEGHTDNVGKDSTNLRLSQSRADSVMSALIKQGVDPGRLEAVGFGATKPIESNRTRAGRAANRRTEFNIVEQ